MDARLQLRGTDICGSLPRCHSTGLAQWQSTRFVSGRSVVQTRHSALVDQKSFFIFKKRPTTKQQQQQEQQERRPANEMTTTTATTTGGGQKKQVAVPCILLSR